MLFQSTPGSNVFCFFISVDCNLIFQVLVRPVSVWDPDASVTVPANAQAPKGIRPLTGTVLTEKLNMFS